MSAQPRVIPAPVLAVIEAGADGSFSPDYRRHGGRYRVRSAGRVASSLSVEQCLDGCDHERDVASLARSLLDRRVALVAGERESPYSIALTWREGG